MNHDNIAAMPHVVFDVQFDGDTSAGMAPYTDTVIVTVLSGNPGGEPGEFGEYLRGCMAEWFDGARVSYNPRNQPPRRTGT